VLRNPWVGIGVLVPSLLAMLVALRALRARLALHPEVSRKTAHVGLGIATLSFPLLFDSVWPVAVLGVATVAVLAALRWLPAVGARFGCVVHGVARRSAGEFYFPAAAAALFVLTDGDAVRFGVPVLTLTFADAAAALVGLQYGRIRLAAGDESKTLEGSAAFFAVAFLSAHVPLLLFTDTGRLESLLIGAAYAALVTLLEAVSPRGTDNLSIPLGGCVLLDIFAGQTARELAALLFATLLIALAFAPFPPRHAFARWRAAGDGR
jgi:phytol kinase